MSRNRKSQSAALRFGPALKALVLCLLIGGSGVGYVWQKDQIGRLGEQIKSREIRSGQLEELNENLRKQLAAMCTTKSLEARIQELKLGLAAPKSGQVLSLIEPGTEAAPVAANRQYAARGGVEVMP